MTRRVSPEVKWTFSSKDWKAYLRPAVLIGPCGWRVRGARGGCSRLLRAGCAPQQSL